MKVWGSEISYNGHIGSSAGAKMNLETIGCEHCYKPAKVHWTGQWWEVILYCEKCGNVIKEEK